jgi:hypothetical protein
MTFAARPGSDLKPGVYDHVERAALRALNRPGMDISGNGAGCSTITGRFEVKDIAVDASGAIERLQIVYEQHCEGSPDALFGEVRWGEPTQTAAAATPSAITWPDARFGAPSFAIPEALLVASEMRIESVSVTGPHADDFSADPASCSGTSCPDGLYHHGDVAGVAVRFAPRRPGTRSATLRILDSNGDTYLVPLRGFTSG